MIGFLRLIGVLNAAIWLGGAIFFTAVAHPALGSAEMSDLLQPKNSPYFAPAIQHILRLAYFEFHIVCALIALIHLSLEWLYLGRPSRKLAFGLLFGLLACALIGGNLLEPHLKRLHGTSYSASAKPLEREAAAKSFRTWKTVFTVANLLAIAGLVVYVWRVTNPSDSPRFVSSVKFRG